MPDRTAAKGDHAKQRPRNHPAGDVLLTTSGKWKEQVVVTI